MTKRRKLTDREFYRAYGLRLRKLRDKLNLTEAEAASVHGVQLRTYRRWEAGGTPRTRASVRGTDRVAQKYGISFDWLLAGNGPMFEAERVRPL